MGLHTPCCAFHDQVLTRLFWKFKGKHKNRAGRSTNLKLNWGQSTKACSDSPKLSCVEWTFHTTPCNNTCTDYIRIFQKCFLSSVVFESRWSRPHRAPRFLSLDKFASRFKMSDMFRHTWYSGPTARSVTTHVFVWWNPSCIQMFVFFLIQFCWRFM